MESRPSNIETMLEAAVYWSAIETLWWKQVPKVFLPRRAKRGKAGFFSPSKYCRKAPRWSWETCCSFWPSVCAALGRLCRVLYKEMALTPYTPQQPDRIPRKLQNRHGWRQRPLESSWFARHLLPGPGNALSCGSSAQNHDRTIVGQMQADTWVPVFDKGVLGTEQPVLSRPGRKHSLPQAELFSK